jgi:TolB protein
LVDDGDNRDDPRRPPDEEALVESIPPEAFFDPTDVDEFPVEDRHRRLRIAVILTLIVAMVVFAAVGGRIVTSRNEAPAETPRVPARLAVIDADGALLTMNADGSSPVPYSVPGVEFGFPTWSPDGKHVASVGQKGDEYAVYVFAVRSTGDAAVAPAIVYRSKDRPPFYLYWAPDGSRVSFLTQEPDSISLRLAPADAGAPDTIVRQGAPLYWDWVDAGRMIAHIGADSDGAFLGEIGLDGTTAEPTQLTPGPFRAPAAGHDGAYRAYVSSGPGGKDRIVVEARDHSSRHDVPIFGMAALNFDAGGRRLAFIAPDQPELNLSGLPIGPLRVVDAISGEATTLLVGRVLAFFWAPDGRTLSALRIPEPDGDDGIASTETGTGNLAADGVDLELSLIDIASGTVRSERPVHLAHTFVYELLPYFDQYALSHRVWSPDGASLALPLASSDAPTAIFRFPADGSEPQRIADGELGFWSP